MITTLLFDFSWVLAFPYSAKIGSSAAYKQAKVEKKPWQNYLTLNQEVIDFVEQIQNKYPSYIFSASSRSMLREIKENLVPPFVDVFSSKELGQYKHQPKSYQHIAQLINLTPEQILFVDDNTSNIEAAKQAGMSTIEFESNQDFLKKVKPLLNLK